jgi:glycerate 2-kinase
VRAIAVVTVLVVDVTGDDHQRPHHQPDNDHEEEQSQQRVAAVDAVAGRPNTKWSTVAVPDICHHPQCYGGSCDPSEASLQRRVPSDHNGAVQAREAKGTDALAVSERWLTELDLERLTRAQLGSLALEGGVDVVAIGKASREMSDAVDAVLGERVLRRLVICDQRSADLGAATPDVVVGEHPIPGVGSWRAGEALLSFLAAETVAGSTLFLLSGGASSLCVVPIPPLTLDDVHGVWDAALLAGVDITTLNKLRAATSAIAGGGVLRHVGTASSRSLILVDNVISGAEWVASGLTFDYEPTPQEVLSLLDQVALAGTELGARLVNASEVRARLMTVPPLSYPENAVVAEPSMMLDYALDEARRRKYRVVNMGSRVHGDVADVAAHWKNVMRRERENRSPTAFVGVGEVTVKVRGEGEGGRCQEFAWLMAEVLSDLERDGAFVARASDGRDFVEGVGGAWVDSSTKKRIVAAGIDWADVAERHDTYPALRMLGQLIDGGHSGWNLCDVYVALW